MELNREQIVKALECHADDQNCVDCPYTDMSECSTEMAKNSLSLIKELTEENERLKARVLEENHLRHQAEEMLANGMSVVKADTVRKMQERLKAKAVAHYFENDNYEVSIPDIDQIAKEMLEEK